MIKVLYLDNHLLVVRKPAGLLIQGDKSGDTTLLDICKQYLKEEFSKPGNVYLGLVHRLDRPVSGVLVLARTSKAASRLTRQFKDRKITKIYRALVQGKVKDSGVLEDYISRKRTTSHLSTPDKGQYAQLQFKRLFFQNNISQLEIELGTGRHHQIRVQFARRGHPILGDFRYGSKIKFGDKAIALHARRLTFFHPINEEEITFEAEPDDYWSDFLAIG